MTPAPIAPNTLRPEPFASEMDDFLAWMAIFAVEIQDAGSAFGLSIAASSTTSVLVGAGSKSLTIEIDKGFVPGMELVVAYTTDPSIRMLGTLTSYNIATGALVMDVSTYEGSGTYAAWSIGPAVIASFDGQTYTDLRLAGKITESVYALAGTVIDPANGSIQTKTLSANTTFTESLADGNSVVLVITAGAYTVTWPTTVWLGGAAPTLSPTGKSHIVLYQIGGVLYGVLAGDSA